jgi:hypothetical protein
MTFKDYLTEVKRSPTRATKLGKYLVTREKRRMKEEGHGPEAIKNNNKFHLPAWHNRTFKPDDEHDDNAFADSWTHAENRFGKRAKNIKSVKVRDLLKHNHQGISFDGSSKINYKMKDKTPINVARSRKTGEMDVVDGFHRLASHWLQGKKTIKANLQDVGRGKKKK